MKVSVLLVIVSHLKGIYLSGDQPEYSNFLQVSGRRFRQQDRPGEMLLLTEKCRLLH